MRLDRSTFVDVICTFLMVFFFIRFSVNLPTMEKYYRSRDAVPNAEFMDTHNFRSLTNVQQLVLPIVSSRFSLDKLIPGFDKMDYRKSVDFLLISFFLHCSSRKMIMTQVLSNLLQDGFSSLEDLPANVRNDVLLELAKLAGEGKLTGSIEIHFFIIIFKNKVDIR